MTILTIRTDNPQAEVGLYEDEQQLSYEQWQAHRQLSATIHQKIQDQLQKQGKTWSDLQGIVAFEGPGSFTGLRIGLSVANALAASYGLPIVGSTGDAWIADGTAKLLAGQGVTVVLPEYGAPVHITQPKH